MTIAWPAQLPGPRRSGYGINPADLTARTDFEAGPPRVRRRFTQGPTQLPVQFMFSNRQHALFEAWWHHYLRDGAEWFTLDLHIGNGVVNHTARFVGPYTAQPYGPGRWTVSGTLEVEETQCISKDDLDGMLLLSIEEIEKIDGIKDELHTVIHEDLPGQFKW